MTEHTAGVFDKEVPSRISEPKKDDSENYIMRSFIILLH
jgi:hypothetical protein